MDQNRTPAGVPTGGRFAAQGHAEATTEITAGTTDEIIEAHLRRDSYSSLDEWATDSGYNHDGTQWINEHGHPVDIRGCYVEAQAAARDVLSVERDRYDDAAGWEGAWTAERPHDAADLAHINELFDTLDT